MASIEYSVVLTSCGRFDLLRTTIVSLLAQLDVAPKKFIVIEDSGDEAVRDAVAGLGMTIDVIVNKPQLGQTASIDKAYAEVTTPYIFHCEDDWEFFRSGFIGESEVILRARPELSLVGLRSRAEQNPRVRNMPVETIGDLKYFVLDPTLHPEYFSYCFNPGLRRTADYLKVGPFAPMGPEDQVSYEFKKAGFAIANLEEPAVRHIGDGRHVHDPTQYKKAKTVFQKLARSVRKRVRRVMRMFSA